MDASSIIVALIGIAGVPLGLLLGEWFRKRQRAEMFADVVFSRRLDAYETLFRLLQEGYRVATEVVNDSDLSAEQRKVAISSTVLKIAEHTDASVLYIDEELGAHCVALYMGAENAQELPVDERIRYEKRLRTNWIETRRMILEDSGAARVNQVFREINKPKITSPVIERIRELRAAED